MKRKKIQEVCQKENQLSYLKQIIKFSKKQAINPEDCKNPKIGLQEMMYKKKLKRQ